MGNAKDAPKKRAISKPAKTTAETIAGLDPEKAIGLKSTPKPEPIQTTVLEGNPASFEPKRTRRMTAPSHEIAAATTKDNYEAELKDRASFKAHRASSSLDSLTEAAASAEANKRVRYIGEGPESGQPVANTSYPMVTSKAPNSTSPKPTMEGRSAGQRAALNFSGSGAVAYQKSGNIAGKSSEESYEQSLRSVQNAKPHEVESKKRIHFATVSKIGVPHGADTICDGPNCNARVKSPDKFANAFDAGNVTWKAVGGVRKPIVSAIPGETPSLKAKDNNLCGGGVCNTAQASKTPTPRGE